MEVPVGDNGKITTATVVSILYGTEDDAPYPVDNIKRIISKVEPVMPEGADGTVFDMVKAAVDTLDPEELLAMDAPPDEYDGESRSIAKEIKVDMSPQQIAELMAKVFSRSFSGHYDANYFMVAATKIKETLRKSDATAIFDHGEQEADTLPWRWCLVGNVVESHEFGEEHEILTGAKQFSPGAKVYIAPAQWGDGFEKVCVIGKPRGKRPLIEVVMKSELIENFRLKKVFQPAVLSRIAESSHVWWGNTDADRDAIQKLIDNINR